MGAETLRQHDEVGVMELSAKNMAVELLHLGAQDVAVGVVVEDDGDRVDPVLYGSGQFVHVVKKAAVAGNRNDGPFRASDLRAQRDGVFVLYGRTV